MNNEHTEKLNILNAQFINEFMDCYNGLKPKKKKQIAPYIHSLYRRWFYSTLVEGTPLSPANLANGMAAYYETSENGYPIPALRTSGKTSRLDFTIMDYDLSNHPAAGDLRKIIEYCTPHKDIHEDHCFMDEQAVEIAESLTINDPFYASFLLELALHMKLLSDLPSLHIRRVTPSKKCAALMEKDDRELFADMLKASFGFTASGLRATLPVPEQIFTESFVKNILKNPIDTDEMFDRIFAAMGYDLEEFLEIMAEEERDFDAMEAAGFDMEMFSFTYIIGVIIDKLFFTTYAYYFRLICPHYTLPFGVNNEVQEFLEIAGNPEAMSTAFYSPCSNYALTAIGREYFKIKETPEEEILFEPMRETIFASEEHFEKFVTIASHITPEIQGMFGEIYEFRITSESDKKLWINLQLPESMTLDDLYIEIAELFGLKENGDYIFTHDKTENRFAEYPSAKRAKKQSKQNAEQVILSDLDFDHMEHMMLAAYTQSAAFSQNPSTLRFLLERVGVDSPSGEMMYPAIKKVSKKMEQILPDMEELPF